MSTNKYRIDLSISNEEEEIIKKTIAPYSIGEFFVMVVEHHFEKEMLKNMKNRFQMNGKNLLLQKKDS